MIFAMKTLIIYCAFTLISTAMSLADIKTDLMNQDASIANAAIETCINNQKEMLPQLRKWATDNDPRLKLRARTALGRITGQFASQTDLMWELDFDQAVAKAKQAKKPILLLHLFGKLNEEFC